MTDGWVDLQVNGQVGVDFSSTDLTADDFMRAAEAIFNSGTGIFLPTVITSSMELYRRNLPLIAATIERYKLEDQIPGIHLEGPFLNPAPGYSGCHNPEWMLHPTDKEFDDLFNLCHGKLKLITVAASVRELIPHIKSYGVTVSIGHCPAEPEELAESVAQGAELFTHLGNGIPNQIPRHRNVIFNALAEDGIKAMIITDGFHLPPEVIKCFIRCKGINNIIVISDGSPAAGLPPGHYNVLGNNAILEPSGKLHNPEKQCLVGSAFTMKRCMDYLRSLELLSEDELEMAGYYNPLATIGIKVNKINNSPENNRTEKI